MRKLTLMIMAMLIMVMSVLIVNPTEGASLEGLNKEDYTVIPNDAIRLRILANSNNNQDQQLKRLIRDRVNAEITEWVEELTSIEDARSLIEGRMDRVEAIIAEVLAEQNIDQTYNVEYGHQVKFPTKLYGSFIYPAGEYEAILITLGNGKGDNWWCVLFPPLCFLDFSNGTSVAKDHNLSKADIEKLQENLSEEELKELDNKKPVEVKFAIKEWLSKLG